MKRLYILGPAVLSVIILASCAKNVDTLPPPPSTSSTTTSAPDIDLSGVKLRALSGQTTTTAVQLAPGNATLTGTISGPEGPADRGVVRIQRLVGDHSVTRDVIAGPNGKWALPGIKGGRYVVRAWRVDDLILTEPQLMFLKNDETRTLNLRLTGVLGLVTTSAVAPNPMRINRSANLAVQLSQRVVNPNGTVSSLGVGGAQVVLVNDSSTVLETGNPVTTDATGRAVWRIRCIALGTASFSVSVNGSAIFALKDVPCDPIIVPTTTITTLPAATSTTSATQTPERTPTTRRGLL